MAFVIGCCSHGHASVCKTEANGTSQSQIQSDLNSCGSGNTLAFSAGNYSIGSTVSWPCGVSMTGPTVPLASYTTGDGYKHLGYIPTATFNWTGGTNAWVFSYPACTSPVSFTYLAVNGNLPNGGTSGGGGGGSINFAGGTSGNITLQYNWFYGNQADEQNDCCAGTLLWVSGSGTAQGYTTMSNLTIQWNQFGSSGGCSNVMNTFFYPSSETGNNNYNYNNNGGWCGAVAISTSTTNLVLENNTVYHTEEGFKFLEPGPNGGQVGCSNPSANQYCHASANVLYNDFSGIHRIGIEAQDTPNPTMNFNYNSWHDPTNPGYGSWVFSLPQYDGAGASYSNINTNANYNVMVENVAPPTLFGQAGGYVPPIEFWSTGTANYNLGQGNPLTCVVSFGYGDTPWTIANNTYQGSGSAVCNEEHQNTNPNPTQTNNSASTTIAALTSVAPTISPASGTFTTSQTVTFTNPGTNRDVNTGIWYTTDGSTPTPGSGTATYIASGGTIAVSTTTTVKAVGMWGAANQPASYASGYGYVPSAVQSATYTSGSPPTLNSVSLTAAGSVTSIALGASVQISAACHYNNGTTTGCNTTDAYGNSVSTWNTSNAAIVSLSSSGLAGGVAIGTANLTAVVAGVTSAAFPLAVTPPSVTLSSVTLATTGGITSIVAGNTNQLVATCHYSDGSTTTCTTTDSHGNAVSTWTSSATTIATVSSGGLVTGVAAGSTNLSAVAGGITSSPLLTLTVTAAPPTLTGGYLGTPGSTNTMTVGGTLQFSAYCQYSNGTTTNCTVPDIYGNGVTQWVSSNTAEVTVGAVDSGGPGLVTAVAAGSPNIQAYVGTVHLNEWVLYVSNPAVSLTGLSLATTGGVTGLFVGYTNQLVATCTYSDGSTTNCTTTDSHGNVAGNYASSVSAHATVGASTGLVTGVATGTTALTAQAGGFTSSALTLSVLTLPSGTYTITFTGPVTFSGTVHF